MNIAEKNQKAIWLQMNHKLQPSFSIRAGTGSYNCVLIHTQTGEHRFRGVGNSEVEAFANAFSKFEAAPAPADAGAANEGAAAAAGWQVRPHERRASREGGDGRGEQAGGWQHVASSADETLGNLALEIMA